MVHLCENILPNNKTLINFDHHFMELIIDYIEERIHWKNFKF
jgi:hypothetical protein